MIVAVVIIGAAVAALVMRARMQSRDRRKRAEWRRSAKQRAKARRFDEHLLL